MAVSHAMLSKLKVALIAGVVQNGQNDAAASMHELQRNIHSGSLLNETCHAIICLGVSAQEVQSTFNRVASDLLI